MRFHPWTHHAALVLGMAVLALTPVEALDELRWLAFFAVGALLILTTLKRRRAAPDARVGSNLSRSVSRQSAVLLVEIDDAVNAQLSDAERTLVMEAIARSVRAGDTVTMVEKGTFSVHLENVTPTLATQVGNRICEQVKDLIVFDKVGGLMMVPVLIGGVIGSTEREPLPLKVARENLTRARDLEGPKLLISSAA
jgi:GGDEF domain-containing protein